MYFLFYLSVILYPNKYTDSFHSLSPSSCIYILTYLALHISSVYFFMTAGKNPGFLTETDTIQQKQDKTNLFVRIDQNPPIDEET
mmetsp:Transcript_23884/g.23568  ORF Transcript_23884/g.23568 Transcript_23884/m.23568 type:complete len:85 (-) Transcript_23884:717-971(-)